MMGTKHASEGNVLKQAEINYF